MRKAAFLAILVMFTFCHSFAADGLRIMESLVMPSRILNQDVKFSVCLPQNYFIENSSYPVVYLLHGLGDDESSWLEYGRISQYADMAIENGEIVPMIFIMPEGYTNYYVNDYKGTFLYQDMFIKELVPYIDSMFRTIADRQHRALMGYSMGGFGALILHLKHPDVFGSAVPLSISIRTDEQYMKEYGPEWDEQWGRLFGAQGVIGPGRITDYYKLNSPFYIIPELSSSEMKNFRIYIDNGDKEQTLCRSNEELHILMRNLDFPHEFRVREGGHSFSYWCSALPNALHFISNAFEDKPYRGDVVNEPEMPFYPDFEVKNILINGESIMYYTPAEYEATGRFYPVLYIAGDFTDLQSRRIMESVHGLIGRNEIAPMLVVFLPGKTISGIQKTIAEAEEKLRIRKSYRFRSFLAYQDMAEQVCDIVMNREQFSSCVIADGYLQKNNITTLLNRMDPDALKKTPFYISAPDKGLYYEGNGNLHMMMRDMEIKHEYRVGEGNGGLDDWMIGGSDGLLIEGFEEILMFVATNFHR